MPPFESKKYFKEAKPVKTGTKFIIIRDTAKQVGEHPEKQLVYLRLKQGRDTHPERKDVERKDVDVPPNEEEFSKEVI